MIPPGQGLFTIASRIVTHDNNGHPAQNRIQLTEEESPEEIIKRCKNPTAQQIAAIMAPLRLSKGPDLTGITFAQQIRRLNPSHPRPPVILLSGDKPPAIDTALIEGTILAHVMNPRNELGIDPALALIRTIANPDTHTTLQNAEGREEKKQLLSTILTRLGLDKHQMAWFSF